jgi:hypothetical protein
MAKKRYDIEKLKRKVEAGKNLTRAEEIYYMMKAFNHTRKQAEYIITIVKLTKKYPNICFD